MGIVHTADEAEFNSAKEGPLRTLGGGGMEEERSLDENTVSRLEEFAQGMERVRFQEYVEYSTNMKKLIWTNFVAGLARGFGMAIGFSVLAAAFVMFLRRLVLLNLPLIHDFLENLLNMSTGSF